MIYERFVCFDLSKQIRRFTLSYKVFILFPLKIYPFTRYKQRFDFVLEIIEFDFDFEKNEKGITLRGANVIVFRFRYFIFEVSDLTIQFYLWHTRSLYVLEFKMRKCKMQKVNLRYYIDCAENVNYAYLHEFDNLYIYLGI